MKWLESFYPFACETYNCEWDSSRSAWIPLPTSDGYFSNNFYDDESNSIARFVFDGPGTINMWFNCDAFLYYIAEDGNYWDAEDVSIDCYNSKPDGSYTSKFVIELWKNNSIVDYKLKDPCVPREYDGTSTDFTITEAGVYDIKIKVGDYVYWQVWDTNYEFVLGPYDVDEIWTEWSLAIDAKCTEDTTNGKLATVGFCRSVYWYAYDDFTSSQECPTYQEIEEGYGCYVEGDYSATQCVKQSDVNFYW